MAQQKQQIKLSERFGIRETKKKKREGDKFTGEGEKFIINGEQSIMQSEFVGLPRCIVFFLSNMTEH